MKSYTRRRLIASVKLGVATMLMLVLYGLIGPYIITPGSFLLGFGFGFTVGITELFFLRNKLKNLSFGIHLLLKSIIIVGVIYITFAFLNLLDVMLDDITWIQYADILFSMETFLGIIKGLFIISFLLFFIQLDRLLGPGVLIGNVTGRYHRPRYENRIFMFLDLKGSTSLAEMMEPEKYFRFLHRYFLEMSEPILETNAEIYQYIGDEIVLTWKMDNGREDANCIMAFFQIEDQIKKHREYFLNTYGVFPEFKAGIHAGKVIVAQIGELKSEIIYNGDILNTTARIQGLCNELGHKLLVSEELINHLLLGPEYIIKKLGSISLRGKSDGIDLCAVERTVY